MFQALTAESYGFCSNNRKLTLLFDWLAITVVDVQLNSLKPISNTQSYAKFPNSVENTNSKENLKEYRKSDCQTSFL